MGKTFTSTQLDYIDEIATLAKELDSKEWENEELGLRVDTFTSFDLCFNPNMELQIRVYTGSAVLFFELIEHPLDKMDVVREAFAKAMKAITNDPRLEELAKLEERARNLRESLSSTNVAL